MRVALLGTRGPGFYGGFETCVAEVASRLADRGHDVTVYARRWNPSRHWRHPGVRIVALPSVHTKNLDTITHTALATVHALVRRPDAAVVFGVGNVPYAWLLRRLGVPVLLNVDGLDRHRAKWGGVARRYLHWAERRSVGSATVLVTDAREIEGYYLECYAAESTFIPYGAPSGPVPSTAELARWGIEPNGYVLYVSRLEPENRPEVAMEGHRRSGIDLPLVMVGGSAYHPEYEQQLRRQAPPGTTFTGFVFGDGYRELQSHARIYLQCTEVGGTHPALVEAMAFCNAVLALDTPEHREVLGDAGRYFTGADDLARHLAMLAERPAEVEDLAARAHRRAIDLFSWDSVTDAYEAALEAAVDAHR